MNTSSSDNDDNESITFSPVDESFISNEQDDYHHHHHYDIPVATTSTNNDTVNNDTTTMDGNHPIRQQVPQQLLTTGISTHPPNNNSSSSSSNLSLLERIQQAKKQQTHQTRKVEEEEPNSLLLLQDDFMNDASNGEYGFVHRHGEKDNDLTQTQQENVHMTRIPDYSASDTIRNDHISSYEYNNGTDGGDYGGGRRIGGGHQGVLSALAKVGNTVGFVAKSAYHGTQYLYHTVVTKNNNNNINSNRRQTQGEFPLQERMYEMDYQRESLLLDPHEVEDGTVLPMEQASPLVGLRSGMMGSSSHHNHVSVGMGGSSSSSSHHGHACIGCLSQFCVDVKDIFMGLSRNKKLAVIAFVLFLVWLFISEERQHHDEALLQYSSRVQSVRVVSEFS